MRALIWGSVIATFAAAAIMAQGSTPPDPSRAPVDPSPDEREVLKLDQRTRPCLRAG
jgi:hypothetical protein